MILSLPNSHVHGELTKDKSIKILIYVCQIQVRKETGALLYTLEKRSQVGVRVCRNVGSVEIMCKESVTLFLLASINDNPNCNVLENYDVS